MNDLISRRAAIDAVETKIKKWNAVNGEGYHVGLGLRYTDVIDTLTELPPARPEPLTDKEQRIFLEAMGREVKVCKQVDDEYRDCCEPYEDSLVRTCHEIIRKVKGALWV